MTLAKQVKQGNKVKARTSRNWWSREKTWLLTAWTLGGEAFLNITNIHLLIRFNKTQEIFSSGTPGLSILLDWNYFWYKYCNLPFLAICCSQFPLLIFLASSWFQKSKIAPQMSLLNKKKWLILILKGFIKQSVFYSVFFLSDFCISVFFSFLIKAFVNLKNWKDFIGKLLYKNGESLKILIEIVCQKLLISNVM